MLIVRLLLRLPLGVVSGFKYSVTVMRYLRFPAASYTVLQTLPSVQNTDHPSQQSPVVGALTLTRLQLSKTSPLFLSVILSTSVSLPNLPSKPFSS